MLRSQHNDDRSEDRRCKDMEGKSLAMIVTIKHGAKDDTGKSVLIQRKIGQQFRQAGSVPCVVLHVGLTDDFPFFITGVSKHVVLKTITHSSTRKGWT